MKLKKNILLIFLFILSLPLFVFAKDNDYVIDLLSYEYFDEFSEENSSFVQILEDKIGYTDYSGSYMLYYTNDDKLIYRVNIDTNKIIMNNSLTTDDNITYTLTDDDKSYYDLDYDKVIILVSDKITEKTNEVYISEVSLEEKSDDVIVNKRAIPDGLSIDVDVKLNNLGDFVKYKVVVKNTTNKDYKIDSKTKYGNSEYIKYEFSFTDNNEIKAGQEKIMYVKISYNREIPESELVNGGFRETRSMDIALVDNESIVNPKTGRTIISIIVILISASIIIYLFNYNKSRSLMVFFMIFGLLVPSVVIAAEKIAITINSNIAISVKPQICFYSGKEIKYYQYDDGMTLEDFFNSNYNVDGFEAFSNFYMNKYNVCSNITSMQSLSKPEYSKTLDFVSVEYQLSNYCGKSFYVDDNYELIDSRYGCYKFLIVDE